MLGSSEHPIHYLIVRPSLRFLSIVLQAPHKLTGPKPSNAPQLHTFTCRTHPHFYRLTSPHFHTLTSLRDTCRSPGCTPRVRCTG